MRAPDPGGARASGSLIKTSIRPGEDLNGRETRKTAARVSRYRARERKRERD